MEELELGSQKQSKYDICYQSISIQFLIEDNFWTKQKHRFGKKAEEIKATSVASAIETIKKLEVKLTEFAKKHRSDIKNDPAFRMKFLEMCGPLGVGTSYVSYIWYG